MQAPTRRIAADIRDWFEVPFTDVTIMLSRVEAEVSSTEAKVGPYWGHNWLGNQGNKGEPKRCKDAGHRPFVLVVPGREGLTIGLENR